MGFGPWALSDTRNCVWNLIAVFSRTLGLCFGFLLLLLFLNIYLLIFAVPGLSCGVRDLFFFFNCSMRTLSCSMHAGYSSPTRDQTRAPCIGSTESYPLDHQGSPYVLFSYSKCFLVFVWKILRMQEKFTRSPLKKTIYKEADVSSLQTAAICRLGFCLRWW